jgi:hypothetical protein
MTEKLNDPLLRAVLGSSACELTCDECFEQLDMYVELELEGARADVVVPGMRAHLDGCRACSEEYLSLRALIESHAG